MTQLRELTRSIYHERQQSGSMLCAQHALNSLLQGNYFTAPDLAHLAKSVDSLERESLSVESYEETSANMDDTGFFSVQVMEQALKVWGLNLVRWRGEEMRRYQDQPYKQLAFILNLEQHWLTLRRFGPALPNVDEDPGEGHWFNLNSSLDRPEWISPLYLSMVLQQMETEGYSVFVVCQANPNAPIALPRVDADIIAATVDAQNGPRGEGSSNTRPGGSESEPSHEMNGFEDEDFELQAALQASLTGGDYAGMAANHHPVPAPSLRPAPPPPSSGFVPTPSAPTGALGLHGLNEDDIDDEGTAGSADPVAASMARNKAIMDQMRREQEAALRESYDDEIARFHSLRRPQGPSAPGGLGQGIGDVMRNAEVEEEHREMLRAIEESRREQRARADAGGAEIDEDDEADEDYIPPQERMPGSFGVTPATHQPVIPAAPHQQHHAVYDDEDAELQAALRASLETIPEGFTIPATPPPRRFTPVAEQESTPGHLPVPLPASTSDDLDEHDYSQDTDHDDEMSDAPAATSQVPSPVIDVDEMRKMRLARFGG
ncbi:Josephin-domain-containing protein [Rickenella mellea]|uniref:ubiquitinyl hydrolase 1 n=1 Tax=Rickenella mellea TaxID=50990 RepID=A0A4Y7QB00_9AGAM|nr:Josephin-domain-containing protein [Rickenella mellea]